MRFFNRLFGRSDPGSTIDRELRFHVEELADHYEAAGLRRADALRRARLELGGEQQIKEAVRDVWAWRWLDDGIRDVQFACRTYARAPASALTAVLTLALGIGVNIALFSVVRQVLLQALPVANPHDLVQIECNSGPAATGGGGACMHSYPAFRLLSERHDGLKGIVAFAPVPNGLVASFEGQREMITGQLASANIFDVLGVLPGAGRLLQVSDDRPGAEAVAVLGHGYWLRAFGGRPDVIGRALVLNNRPVTIVGVLPRAFRGITFGNSYDVMLPLARADAFRAGPGPGGSILASANMGWLTFLGRRQGGVSSEDVSRRLEPVFRQSVEAYIAPIPLDIRRRLNLSADGIRVSVTKAALGAKSNVRQTLEPTLRVVVVVAILILLITCANLAGLFLAHATNRQREFGLRLALGAGRSRLLRQVFTESLLLAALGGGLGLLLAQWIGPAGFTLATDDTGLRAVDLEPDRWTMAATAALCLLAALVVGTGSVLRASAANPQEALRPRRGHASPWLTKLLLTGQIGLTLTLVGSATLLVQTLTNFRRVEIGFEPKQLVTVTMDAGLGTFDRARATAYVRQAAAALAAVPGVAGVTYSSRALGTGIPINLTLDVPGASGGSSGILSAGPRFVRTLGLTLLAGRDFEEADREDSEPVALVNESFATHFFGAANAVGRRFAFRGPGNPPIAIVGVVRDARDRGVKRPSEPVAYLPFGQREVNVVTFTVRAAASLSSLSDTLRRTLDGVDPAVGIAKMWTVDAQLDDVLRRERLLAALGAVFGGLALLLLAVGLYGMLNAMVVRRTTEIGVRMALGASRAGIVRLLAGETLVMIGSGIGLGVAGYLAAGGLIQSELFGVSALDGRAAAAAVALLVGIAALAVGIPARRATLIEPTEALRYDRA